MKTRICSKYFAHDCSLLLFRAPKVASIMEERQGRISNPVVHLRWSFFAKIVNGLKFLTIFPKNSIVYVGLGSKYASGRFWYEKLIVEKQN